MPQDNKQLQQPNPRMTIIGVVIFLLVVFFVGQQYMAVSQNSQTTTDKLAASEFLQAVEQNRVTSVTYSAGDYTITGSYYPAATAGSTAANAFNDAFSAINAALLTEKTDEGKPRRASAPPTWRASRSATSTTSPLLGPEARCPT